MGTEKGCHYLLCTKTVFAESTMFIVLSAKHGNCGRQGVSCKLNTNRIFTKKWVVAQEADAAFRFGFVLHVLF